MGYKLEIIKYGEEKIMGLTPVRKGCKTCHRTIVWMCPPPPPSTPRSCEICKKYGFPNEEHNLPYPCKTCGQNFEVEHVTSPKGLFKSGNRVNCDKCIKEKKQ